MKRKASENDPTRLKHHSLALQSILSNRSENSTVSITCVHHPAKLDPSTEERTGGEIGGTDKTVHDFFENIWQRHPKLYKRKKKCDNGIQCSSTPSCPLDETLSMGWNGVIKMIDQSCKNCNKATVDSDTHSFHLRPLFLQNQTPLQQDEIQMKYSSNPYAAYLDGCSIIQNHAEYFSIPLSNLCLDLQKTFPHVYCNTYLTPPNSSTVKAHADDRDVFVIQIEGRKKWKVYSEVPIPYPYSHEQVGKNVIPVPSSVTLTKIVTINHHSMLQ